VARPSSETIQKNPRESLKTTVSFRGETPPRAALIVNKELTARPKRSQSTESGIAGYG
jgi:hypothetical protein